MGMFDWFTELFDHRQGPDHNPATGLPITSMTDMLGNPWGTDLGDQQIHADCDAAHQMHQLGDPYSHHASGTPMSDDWQKWHRHDWMG